MTKGPGYRKPVPVYVPSPPSSPPQPAGLRLSQPLYRDTERPLPPLPSDWREVVGHASRVISETSLLHDREEFSVETTTQDVHKIVFDESSSTTICSGVAREQLKRPRRRTYQQYRPPTPPLPPISSRRRTSIDETGSHYFHACGRRCLQSHPQDFGWHLSDCSCERFLNPASSSNTIATRTQSFRTEKYAFRISDDPSMLFTPYNHSYATFSENPILHKYYSTSGEPGGHKAYVRDVRDGFSVTILWQRIGYRTKSFGRKLKNMATSLSCFS